MSKALNYIDKNYQNVSYVINVTDGAPNYTNLTKQAAKVLHDKGIKICSSYIGSGDIPDVLKNISDAVFKSDIDSAISNCTGKVKEDLIGAAVIKIVDENKFSF
jgi:hypothetical protein